MVQLDTPVRESRKPITSPFAGGMTTAQLEGVLRTTPQMSRFNPSRRRLRALNTPDARASKSEIITANDQVATGPIPSSIVHPPVSLIREDPGEGINKPSADVRADDVQGSVSKSTNSICSHRREDNSCLRQQDGTFPKRFLKAIAKRKQLRKGGHKESKVSTSVPMGETLSTFLNGEKSYQQAGFSSHESADMARVDTPAMGSEPLSDETSGDSRESTSLEDIIRTAPRTSTSEAMNNFTARHVSLSFGPGRLARGANLSLDNEGDDGDDDLNDLEVAILGLCDSNNPSEPMPDPDDSNGAGINHKSQTGCLNRQKQRKEKKMPRRLPIDELYLVSERAGELSQEDDVESVQYLKELSDDPISQDASDALQVADTVARTKRELNTLQRRRCGAFGEIDTREFRFPKLESTSPQTRTDNRREVRSSHSDGFVGSEADTTGQFMLGPKQKRVNISIWGLTTRVAQLQLVREKDYELFEESNGQIKKMSSARNSRKPSHKQAQVDVPVLIEPKAQAVETRDDQRNGRGSQSCQDRDNEQKDRPINGHVSGDGIIPNAGNEPPLALHREACRDVTFDERLDFNQRARTHTSNSLIRRDMEMTFSQRCDRGECEEDGPLWHESERSVMSMSSDDDGPEESDETSDNSSEELDDEQQMEGDSDAQTTSAEDIDSQSDATSISALEEPSEVSDNSQNSDGEIDGEGEDGEGEGEGEEEEEEEEEEKREYSTFQAVLEKEMNKKGDEGIVFIGSPSGAAELISKEGDNRDSFHDFDEEVDLHKQLRSGEEITTVSLLGESKQHKENSPFEDLLLEEFQRAEAGAIKESNEIQPTQLSVAVTWQNTANAMSTSEAGMWRPRRPKPGSMANETGEDIVDIPSPISAIVKRRRSAGLQTHRRRKFSSRPLNLTTCRPGTPPCLDLEETQVVVPEIPETQLAVAREMSPELGTSQATDLSDELGNTMIDALPPDNSQNFLPHFSQLSFFPEDMSEESYFYRASQSLRGNFETPKSRALSTPARFYLELDQAIVTPASIQPSIQNTASVFSAPITSLKFSQQSYRPTPRSEKSLSRLTRQASFAFGTLPVSSRKRTKTLPFVPPFKKSTLKI